MTDIEQGAFWKSGITSFEVSDSTDYIGNECFAFCKKLKNVNIGKKLRWFELNHFWGCANLQKINVNKANKTYYSKDGVLYSKDGEKNYLYYYPAAGKQDSYTVKANVIASGRCFNFVKRLKNVVYEDWKSFGNNFYNCNNLKITLPAGTNASISSGNLDNGDEKEFDPFKKCSGIKIYGDKGNFMEEYAKKKGFQYLLREQ